MSKDPRTPEPAESSFMITGADGKAVSGVEEGVTIDLAPKGDAALVWLSFCDADRPKGQQFLGACVVPGHDVVSGAQAAWRLRCNPGGQVAGVVIPAEAIPLVAQKWRNRLLTRAECEEMDREIAKGIS